MIKGHQEHIASRKSGSRPEPVAQPVKLDRIRANGRSNSPKMSDRIREDIENGVSNVREPGAGTEDMIPDRFLSPQEAAAAFAQKKPFVALGAIALNTFVHQYAILDYALKTNVPANPERKRAPLQVHQLHNSFSVSEYETIEEILTGRRHSAGFRFSTRAYAGKTLHIDFDLLHHAWRISEVSIGYHRRLKSQFFFPRSPLPYHSYSQFRNRHSEYHANTKWKVDANQSKESTYIVSGTGSADAVLGGGAGVECGGDGQYEGGWVEIVEEG
ncbi:hypothetical protein SBOR_4084 [Sclerotinia borealis F-4128]|uniref:Uncharacterized protein n=1 Tax=Sclerotinia borealis (strain F-4128) TaxID=1432307 RepID=W9CI35_SCLBF|nr:hypothetical protein SBOR_4084 [Sclerotinia borealis F-4128]